MQGRTAVSALHRGIDFSASHGNERRKVPAHDRRVPGEPQPFKLPADGIRHDGGLPRAVEQHARQPRFTEGLRHILRQRDMVITIILFFIGLGIFNAVSSMVDSITASIGVKDSNGLIGGLMLIGGVIGAVVLPLFMGIFVALSVVSLIGVLLLRESPLIVTDADKARAGKA